MSIFPLTNLSQIKLVCRVIFNVPDIQVNNTRGIKIPLLHDWRKVGEKRWEHNVKCLQEELKKRAYGTPLYIIL